MLTGFRTLIFTLGYSLSCFFYGLLSPAMKPLPERVRHKILISWAMFIIWWVKVICGVRYRIHGLEHVQNLDQPVVVMSKHQSTWETLFLQGLFWPATTILKRELLKIPFFGWGLAGLQPIAIDRSNPKEALKQVKQGGQTMLSRGYNVIVFPEGTRLPPGERKKYARSGADIATAAGVNVIPVAHDAGKFWPPKQQRKLPGEITVYVGAPISTADKNSKQVIEEVENWIEGKMETL